MYIYMDEGNSRNLITSINIIAVGGVAWRAMAWAMKSRECLSTHRWRMIRFNYEINNLPMKFAFILCCVIN